MLKALFHWFDQNHGSYWAIAYTPTALLALWLIATFLRERQHRLGTDESTGAGAGRCDWRYGLMLFVVLLAWRWPPLFGIKDLNPDESWLLAGALTLKHDPVFWRSVDGITSGPLNFFGLLPLNLLGVPLDYFGARLTGLLMVWGALVSTYALLRSTYGTTLARFAVLPPLVFFAAAIDGDFIHYSSEHPSILISSVGLWLLWAYRPRAETPPGSVRGAWLAGGAIVGLLPWAKLQSAPIALLLAIWGAWLAWTHFHQPARSRLTQIAKLAAATLAPSVVILAAVVACGVFADFYKSYILDNLTYVAVGFPFRDIVKDLTRLSLFTWHYPAFLIGAVSCGVLAAIGCLVQRRPPGALHVFALLYTLVGCYTVVAPGRGFHHYLLYSVMPLSLWAAVGFAELATRWNNRRWQAGVVLGFVALTAVMPLHNRQQHAVPWIFGKFLEYWRQPYDEVGLTMNRYRRDGDSVAIWGWYGHAYVQSQLPQATREAESEHQLRDWPLRDTYFRPQYLADLRRNDPAIFVDAVGPGAFFFIDRERYAHETFPELRDYIGENYDLIFDGGHARVFVRKDRVAEAILGARPAP